jgi:peptidoglycan/LPS O-acetylase OafA/YrhL
MPEYADTDEFSIFTHAWTVGVELKFYLLVPAILFLVLGSVTWRFATVAIAAALFAAHGAFLSAAYCAVLCGVLLALALERPHGYAVVAGLTRVPAMVPLALIVALLVLLHQGEWFTVLAAVTTWLLAYTIVQEAAVSRLLTWRPLTWLGERSYGAYLLHFLALRIGYMMFGDDGMAAGLMATVVCVALTVPAAELLHRAVEAPARELGRRLSGRRRVAALP